MNDLTDLHRAFAELERRADAHLLSDAVVRDHPAVTVSERATPLRARRRPVLVGATAAVLLAGVTGAVLLTANGFDLTTAPAGTAPGIAVADPTATTAGSTVAERFRAALADVATFTVTSSGGDDGAQPSPSTSPTGSPAGSTPLASGSPVAAGRDGYLVGVLTTTTGARGGYDVETAPHVVGPASCATDVTGCVVTTLADGSSLAVGTMSVADPDGTTGSGVTLEVVLIRPDAVRVSMHVSNQADPKGMSESLSAQPPLTTAQMTTVVTSPAWG